MTDKKAQIYLMCGSGGVGKTTMAAALGLKLAKQGHRTVVLTIDPAKRLANSLGLKELGDAPQKILEKKSGTAELFAMMLDTKRTFDHIVEKYAPSRQTVEKIFSNKVYQHLSQMLAGSQEYMAMEKLHEIWQQDEYDCIVIDTPPMQNAVDFLEAPRRMNDMINNSMLHLLLKPSMLLGKKGLRLFERGSQQILKVFDRVIGFAFMQDISEMLISFQELISGFQSRAMDVKTLLASEQTHFVIVCTTQQNSIAETKMFRKRLMQDGYGLHAIVANRIHLGQTNMAGKIRQDKMMLENILSGPDAESLIENYKKYLPLIKHDGHCLEDLKTVPTTGCLCTIPLFENDIHDLEGLSRLSEYLKFSD